MARQPILYGTCTLCGQRLSKAGLTRHLATCAPKHDVDEGRAKRLLKLRIESDFTTVYWLDVEIRASTTLEELDIFLRDIWLECCGHLSSFDINRQTYMVTHGLEPIGYPGVVPGEVGMDARIGDVVSKGSRFSHTYDFGSSTNLTLRVSGERHGRIGDAQLRLLSRNEAMELTCDVCGDPAAWVCSTCRWETGNPFYCDGHREKHDCVEAFILPVVNSPRMGVCGYTGRERFVP